LAWIFQAPSDWIIKEERVKTRLLAVAIALCAVAQAYGERVPLSDIQKRKNNKNSISLFQPWTGISGGIIDTMGLHGNQQIALHDLMHNSPESYGLKWANKDPNDSFPGNAEMFDSASIAKGLAFRKQLLALNPNMILIGEIRFYDAAPTYYPSNSPYWKKRANGDLDTSAYKPYIKIDYGNASFQQHCANQCIALLETGVVDGIFLDWATNAYEPFFKAVRSKIGDEAVIIGNVNHHFDQIDKILPFLSGVYMESGWWGMENNPTEFFKRVRLTISMCENQLRAPKLINTEIWSQPGFQDLDSTSTPGLINLAQPQEHVMRAGVAAHYTLTSGYFSFYPQTFKNLYHAEHMHLYHDFLNANLGAPSSTAATRKDSAYVKEWGNGAVVFNPPSAPTDSVTLTFPDSRRSQATGKIGTTHKVAKNDGDIFLKGPYTQLYPAPNGFLSAGLPALRSQPDPNYTSSLPIHSRPRDIARAKPMLKAENTGTGNKRVIILNGTSAAGTRYFNTAGRQVEIPASPGK
jgi:hypothetical protein